MENKKFTQTLAVIIVLVFFGWFFYQNMPLANQPISGEDVYNPTPDLATGRINTINIEGSTLEGAWTMYTTGARVIVTGENLTSVTVKAMPTGAGMGQEYPDGAVLGEAVNVGDVWSFALPNNLSATNVWAEGVDEAGSVVKSPDLGNVGYKE